MKTTTKTLILSLVMVLFALNCRAQDRDHILIGKTFSDISELDNFGHFKFVRGQLFTTDTSKDYAFMRYIDSEFKNLIMLVEKQENGKKFKILDYRLIQKLDSGKGFGICKINGSQPDVLVIHEYKSGDYMSRIISAWTFNQIDNSLLEYDPKNVKSIDSGSSF